MAMPAPSWKDVNIRAAQPNRFAAYVNRLSWPVLWACNQHHSLSAALEDECT